MFRFFRKEKPLTASEQLKRLAKAGLRPRPEIGLGELVKFRQEAYMEKPYLLLLIALGGAARDGGPVCSRIWHVHRDSIRQTGDYVRAALRMAELTGGELSLADAEDSLLPDAGQAALRLTLLGRMHQWEFPWIGAALDPELLLRLAALLKEHGSPRQYAYAALGGPDALVICATQQELEELNGLTGLGFQWLAGSGFRF